MDGCLNDYLDSCAKVDWMDGCLNGYLQDFLDSCTKVDWMDG